MLKYMLFNNLFATKNDKYAGIYANVNIDFHTPYVLSFPKIVNFHKH